MFEQRDEIYFDHAASSIIFKEVNNLICQTNELYPSNPSSIHQVGVRSSLEIEKAREVIANQLNVNPEGVFYTSGGTEANNWIIYAILSKFKDGNKKSIVTSEIEHPSILKPLEHYAEMFGYNVSKVKTNNDGRINIDHLSKLVSDQTLFCSFMHVNNETGAELQLLEIGEICKKYSVILHVDACQGFLKRELNLIESNIDFLTINSHKIHGPKGVGALVSRRNELLIPMLMGGGHELGLRSGTLNTSGIVGFSKAIEIFKLEHEKFKLLNLKENLIIQLKSEFSNVTINGNEKYSSQYILNFSIDGIHAKDLFWHLNKNKIYVSTSSACSSKLFKPSYVLTAMGLNDKQNFEAVRVSFGPRSSIEEVNRFLTILKELKNK